jgi:CheY-like chemotaxis protein
LSRGSGYSFEDETRRVPVTKRGKSLLCIGNDPVNLNLRCALLRQHGWRVLSSGNGHEGILRFGKEAVNAVVVDLNDDGSEAALIIGELKRLRPEMPVILMKDENALAPGAAQHASAVVLKSQEEVDLIKALEAVLPSRTKSKS